MSTRLKIDLKRRWWLLAVLPLATGAALVVHILANVSLGLSLIGAAVIVVPLAALSWRRLTPEGRSALLQRTVIGLLTGLLATLCYDGSRWFVVTVFHDTFWPFDVFPVFGYAIAGSDISRNTAAIIGTVYHYGNGVLFAVAYAILLGPRGWWAGILWALGLETLMLSLYPGWLHPKAFSEFVSVSFIGHIVYGAVLGIGSRQMLLWQQKRRNWQMQHTHKEDVKIS